MNAICCLLGIFIFSPLTIAKALTVPRADGSSIVYYLKENNSDQLLVLVQGSDCNNIIDNTFVNEIFPQILPNADVLTVEKYGIDGSLKWALDDEPRTDCPKSYMENDSPSQRLADYLQVINSLREKKNYKKIVLLGGSEGAFMVNLIASEADYINAGIALNGGGEYLADGIMFNMRSEIPAEEIESAISWFTGFQQQVLNSDYLETNNSEHGFKWWKEMFTMSQLEILKKTKIPILIIQTLSDKSVNPQLAINMTEQLKAAKKDNITFYTYPELNHGFVNDKGERKVEEILLDIKAWLLKI